MPLPQSGVSRFEDFMNSHLPSGIYMSDEDIGVYRTDDHIKDVEVKYYWAQIQLRITLNTIHTLLYKDVGQDNPPGQYSPLACAAVASIQVNANIEQLCN